MVDGRDVRMMDFNFKVDVGRDYTGDVVAVEVVGLAAPPSRCGQIGHVSYGNARSCYCGKRGNPAHRTWWQRRADRRARIKRNRKAMLG